MELHIEHGATRASAKGALRDPLRLRGASLGLLLAGPDMALLAPLTGVPFPATPPYELGGRLDHAEGGSTGSPTPPGGSAGATWRGR
jgi:hypothetical protein